MYFVDWYEQCGTVVAWYEQHGGLTRVYVSCFVVVMGRKKSFDMISAVMGRQLSVPKL